MTQKERLIYLIHALQEDMPEYHHIHIPDPEIEQKQLLRAFMNIRPPIPASKEFLKVQDEYLSEEIKNRGVLDADTLFPVPKGIRICLWRGDITRLKADAIVNAANSSLLGCFNPLHSCIDNIIHSYAGIQLRLACHDIINAQGHEEPTGTAKITPGFNLPCKYILHTVGPVISGALTKSDCHQLESCYQSCLELAAENDIQSIAFCCISTGVFHFPKDKAAEIAVDTVLRFLNGNESIRRVVFNVFTEEDFRIYSNLLK